MTQYERLNLRLLSLITWTLILMLRHYGMGKKADQGREELQKIADEIKEEPIHG